MIAVSEGSKRVCCVKLEVTNHAKRHARSGHQRPHCASRITRQRSGARRETREMSVWPICLTAGEESSTRCEFATVAQCRATSDGNMQGTCIINPAYRSSAYAQYRPLTY